MASHDDHRRLTRRHAVALAGSLTAGLAGCSGLFGGSGAPFHEGFEDGRYENSLEDFSQTRANPRVTEERVPRGNYALRLSSTPGTSTACRVLSKRSFTGDKTYSVVVRPTRVAGPEGGIFMALVDEETRRRLALHSSGYHGGVTLDIHDAEGDRVDRLGVVRTDPYQVGEELDIGLSVGARTVRATVGESVLRTPTPTDWADRQSKLRLDVNAWGNGHSIAANLDEVTVRSAEEI